MTRRAHKPTDDLRTLVRKLSGLGTSVDDVAYLTNISDETVRKYYRVELNKGRAEANVAVARALFQAATRANNPNVVAQMFWLKNRAGWKDMGAITADSVNTLAIEFVGPRALAEAVRATQGKGTTEHSLTINGVAEQVEQHAGTNGAVEPVDTEENTETNDDAASDLFEAPLPEPDPEPGP